MELPDSFKRNVIGAFPEGAAWIDSLPRLLADCQERWGLVLGAPFALSYNYVVPCVTAKGQDAALKIGVPHPGLRSEIQALRMYGGGAAVSLLDCDEARGFLLLERLRPGQMLASMPNDEQATRIAAQLMRDLWRPLPPDHSFPSVRGWAQGLQKLRRRFHGETGPFPPRLVELAESLFSELLASSEPTVLLHGDLHHFNILSAQRRPWVAIDPKGLAGERAYEAGALLRNPDDGHSMDLRVQQRRVDVLTDELALNRRRIVGWGIGHAVLSGWWSYEESGRGWESAFACAEVLARLLR